MLESGAFRNLSRSTHCEFILPHYVNPLEALSGDTLVPLSSYIFIGLSRYKMPLLKSEASCSGPWLKIPSTNHSRVLAAVSLHSVNSKE